MVKAKPKRVSRENFIVYVGDDEVIVTTEALEKATLRTYFKDGDRDIDSYNREEVRNDEAVMIKCGMSVS